jgi:integrase/recombinase XerD
LLRCGNEGKRDQAGRELIGNMLRKKAEKSDASITEPGIRAYMEPGEVACLEKAANNLRDRLLIRLLFHLGCRVSEALGITVEDIDLIRGTITIQHLKLRMKLSCPNCGASLGKAHTYCPGCGAKVDKVVAEEREHRRVRTLPIDTDTLAMIKNYISRGGPVVKEGKRFIFGINSHRGWQIVRACGEAAGIPKLVNPETGRMRGISPHRLRDSFAVNAMKVDDSGDGLRLLQEHLGHQSFNTTAKYRKISGKEHQEWYQRLWEKSNF